MVPGDRKMTTREELRRDGAAIRARLFAEEPEQEPADEFLGRLTDLVDELTYGAVWSRPGLALPDRMIASLAALCAVQRLGQLRRHVAGALDLGLSAQAIVEVFVQCGIYAGFPASEEAIDLAGVVVAERGAGLPFEDSRPTSRNDLDALDDPAAQDDLSPPDDPAALDDSPPSDDRASLDELMVRGRALLEELHGSRGYEGYAAPDNTVTGALYPLAIQYGYGEIWHRPGLDRRQRAIIAVAAFTALRLEGQVKKFGQSALNVGLHPGEIIETVIQTGPYSGLAPALNALAALSEVLKDRPGLDNP